MLTLLLLTAMLNSEPNCDCVEQAKNFKEMRLMVYMNNPDAPKLNQAESDKIQTGHLEFLGSQWRAGNASLIGPMEHPTMRGLALYSIDDEAKLKKIVSQDPAMQSNRFIFRSYLALVDPRQIQKGTDSKELTSYWVVFFTRTPKTDLPGYNPASETAPHEYEHKKIESKTVVFTAKFLGEKAFEKFWVIKAKDQSEANRIASNHPSVKAAEWTYQATKWWTSVGNFPAELPKSTLN